MKTLPVLTKRVVVVSGCMINQLLRADQCHVADSTIDSVVQWALRHRLAIHTLPCPEHAKLGLGRPAHGRKWYQEHGLRPVCARIAKIQAEDIAEYVTHGVRVVGVIGIERSPACSTRQDNPSNYYPSGIFMEELRRCFLGVGLDVPFISVTGTNTETQRKKLEGLIQ